jgi:hypothetical protein
VYENTERRNYYFGQRAWEKNLATIVALLMLLAFTADRMIEPCRQLFRQVRGGLYWACVSYTPLAIHVCSFSDQMLVLRVVLQKNTWDTKILERYCVGCQAAVA